MRTYGKRLRPGGGPDRTALCSYCGALYLRSQLTRDPSGNLACPTDARGLDKVSLDLGNARLMRSQQPKVIGPVDGSADTFVPGPSPGFINPNGPPGGVFKLATLHMGQSNDGNQDNVRGPFNGRTSLVWSAAIPDYPIVGPVSMSMQAGGHSFEWQMAYDLSVTLNTNIMVHKCWADGAVVNLFLPNSAVWVKMYNAATNLGYQAKAAGIKYVEVVWCQGESNTPNNVAGLLPTYQSDTAMFFDLIKGILEPFGLSVHFTIIKTNANITTGPNPGDPGAASLAFVRAAQDALAATRSDTSTVSLDYIVPASAGGVHYINGQTLTGGSTVASSLAQRYASVL